MKAKEIKWCPAHSYPLPCDKCGLGLEEIGFEKGRQAGIKEVVNWINQNYIEFLPGTGISGHFEMQIDPEKWHKKLKEWGL